MSHQADSPVHELLRRTAAFAASRALQWHVVGGWIRDALLDRPPRRIANVDLAVPSGALAHGRALAEALGGSYVCLDADAGTARVIVGDDAQRCDIDLADFRAADLAGDLSQRDFTINAMAAPLSAWQAGGDWRAALVDPRGGGRDLGRRLIRPCFDGAFAEDPVRILRAFRFAAQLQFTLDASAGPLMQASLPELRRVSGERVRDELFAILATDRAADAMRALNALGALDVIIPELAAGRDLGQGDYHHLDVLGHQLEAVSQADRILAGFAEFSEDLRAPMAAYCAQEPVEPRSYAALIKLSALLHDVGKPATRRVKEDGDIWFLGHEQFGAELVPPVAERLKLSNREAATLRALVLYHLRPGHLSRESQLTRRAIFRFFRDLGEDGPACLLLWWSDRMATRGPSSNVAQIPEQRARLEELLDAYFLKAEEAVRPPKLIDGNELMAALKLPAGPQLGRLLLAIQEAQAEGAVATKDEALQLARTLISSQRT